MASSHIQVVSRIPYKTFYHSPTPRTAEQNRIAHVGSNSITPTPNPINERIPNPCSARRGFQPPSFFYQDVYSPTHNTRCPNEPPPANTDAKLILYLRQRGPFCLPLSRCANMAVVNKLLSRSGVRGASRRRRRGKRGRRKRKRREYSSFFWFVFVEERGEGIVFMLVY